MRVNVNLALEERERRLGSQGTSSVRVNVNLALEDRAGLFDTYS